MIIQDSSLFYLPEDSKFFPIVPAISITYRKYQIFLTHELKKYDIFPADVPFLFSTLLEKENGILQDDLIKNLGVTKSVATRVLHSLEERKFLYRTESAHSRRHKLIMPYEKLFQVEPILQDTMEKWYSIITDSMDEDEVTQLIKSLSKLTKNTSLYKY